MLILLLLLMHYFIVSSIITVVKLLVAWLSLYIGVIGKCFIYLCGVGILFRFNIAQGIVQVTR